MDMLHGHDTSAGWCPGWNRNAQVPLAYFGTHAYDIVAQANDSNGSVGA